MKEERSMWHGELSEEDIIAMLRLAKRRASTF